MNEEEVKDAIINYFQKRKGRWEEYNDKSKPVGQIGWDLSFVRPNAVLHIEVKGITRDFDSPFIAAIGAVLMRRGDDVLTNRGKPNWCARYCIAFNTDRKNKYDLIRALFYKLSRPDALANWDLLTTAKAKYVYLVRNSDKKVLELKWKQVTTLVTNYLKKIKLHGISPDFNKNSNAKKIKQLKIIEKMFDNETWV